jgi:hypothetical protein
MLKPNRGWLIVDTSQATISTIIRVQRNFTPGHVNVARVVSVGPPQITANASAGAVDTDSFLVGDVVFFTQFHLHPIENNLAFVNMMAVVAVEREEKSHNAS